MPVNNEFRFIGVATSNWEFIYSTKKVEFYKANILVENLSMPGDEMLNLEIWIANFSKYFKPEETLEGKLVSVVGSIVNIFEPQEDRRILRFLASSFVVVGDIGYSTGCYIVDTEKIGKTYEEEPENKDH